MIRLRSMIILG